jgi:hypothetical protein
MHPAQDPCPPHAELLMPPCNLESRAYAAAGRIVDQEVDQELKGRLSGGRAGLGGRQGDRSR